MRPKHFAYKDGMWQGWCIECGWLLVKGKCVATGCKLPPPPGAIKGESK